MKEAIHGNFKHGELQHGEKSINIPKPFSFWRATIRLIKALFCVLYFFIKEKLLKIKPKNK